jgi:hypothetical protein
MNKILALIIALIIIEGIANIAGMVMLIYINWSGLQLLCIGCIITGFLLDKYTTEKIEERKQNLKKASEKENEDEKP